MVQWLRLYLPMQGVQAQSLVRELRLHMPPGQRPKQNRSSIITSSIKTLKRSTSKRKKESKDLKYSEALPMHATHVIRLFLLPFKLMPLRTQHIECQSNFLTSVVAKEVGNT